MIAAALAVLLSLSSQPDVPACTVLNNAEIRKLAGAAVPDFAYGLPRNGSKLGGGGSECEIPGFSIQLDAAPVSGYADRMKIWGSRTKFERITGVGDEAHFYIQDADIVGIYTRAGAHMLVVSRSLRPGDTAASVRPLLETVTKAVLAKLK